MLISAKELTVSVAEAIIPPQSKPIDDEDAIFLVDVEDTEFVDQNLKLTVQGKRGGDTNAVGDGYGKIFKTPKTGSWQRKLSA